MYPSEVIVLAVEVAFRCPAPVVIGDDVLLGVVPVVGEDAAVHIFGTEQPLRLGRRVLVACVSSSARRDVGAPLAGSRRMGTSLWFYGRPTGRIG